MKIRDLKKLIKEVYNEVMAETPVDINQAILKLKEFERNIGGKKASLLLRRTGDEHQWKVIADVAGKPDKFVELATANSQEEGMKIIDNIYYKISGKTPPKTVPMGTTPDEDKLSQEYTVYDANFEQGKTNNVRKLHQLMSRADYPGMEPKMTPEDKQKYLSFSSKQPKNYAAKWTGD